LVLKYAAHLGVQEIDITSDSKLVVEQVNGNWRCDSKTMRDYQREARLFARQALRRGVDTDVGSPAGEHLSLMPPALTPCCCSMNPWRLNRPGPIPPQQVACQTLARTRIS
jgi:hypothetical protein